MSVRSRLLLGMALVALVLGGVTLVVARSTRAHLLDQVDEQLRDARPQVRGRISPGVEPDPPPEAQDEVTSPAPRLSSLYVGQIDRGGDLITLSAPNLRGDDAPLPRVGEGDVTDLAAGRSITVPSDEDGTRYRMQAVAAPPRGRITVVALPIDDVDAAVRRLGLVAGAGVLAVLAVLGLVTWWVVRLGLRPLRHMTSTAGAIAAGDLSHRVPEAAAGTEAAALGTALNRMLGRIEHSFDERTASEARLRQFLADASHELRTPITTIRGYAELYESGAIEPGTDLDDAMRRTHQEAVRMGGLVEDLLQLARLDRGRAVERTPVDLATLAGDAAADALAVAPDRTVTVDAPHPVPVLGDESGLRQVVANLVGNALAHAPHAALRIRAVVEGDRGVLEVADDGPGMAPDDAARAFERFYRADASRHRHSGGSGLGLAIVEATVQAHDGAVSIDTTPGRGTNVRVELPLAP